MANYEFGICTLDINGVYPEDSGTVTCRATNKGGTTETSGKLLCRGRCINLFCFSDILTTLLHVTRFCLIHLCINEFSATKY